MLIYFKYSGNPNILEKFWEFARIKKNKKEKKPHRCRKLSLRSLFAGSVRISLISNLDQKISKVIIIQAIKISVFCIVSYVM